jgi:hypothetical protein
MNIFRRLLVTILFTVLASLSLLVNAEGAFHMHEPKGLKIIQNAIEKDAKQHGIEVRIEWRTVKNHGIAATVYHNKIEKK